ncbi:inorganic phosphate transporter [Mariprofundus ferrooxydans]|uniref:Phosphate transporter n=1 Tax=Mariprofundus ferrooxydans PV-1 TaxID=314345 RepID=Q0EZH1_9PROT|nr:inorganic phosphate transporter [Mariprofundus ferrooxydans]EAU54733.1 Phosphate transporter [Mariprofundus ferrooxydans PV-1]KON46714.1 phosphate transporter [Mariprofundus ferrooxydans]
MDSLIVIATVTVVVLVVFDYTNGFHDASNIIATSIASRAMTPLQAVLIVGFFEFLGPLLGGTAVADTIGSFVDISELQAMPAMVIILCGVSAAVTWNIITWRFGIPSSSSHALVGGLVGAVLVSAGSEHIVWGVRELADGHLIGVFKVLLALLISPIIGFWGGFLIHRWVGWLLRSAPLQVNHTLRRMQFLTTAALAFAHGANDAQKSMGVITLVLLLGGFIPQFAVPFWVVLLCAVAITLGIMSGGWRIVRTVGFGIYKIRPLHAVNAQITAGVVIFSAALLGGPVSTTHVVSSSIMGIGASERPRSVRWRKAGDIVSTWIITIPGAALIAAAGYLLLNYGLNINTGGG